MDTSYTLPELILWVYFTGAIISTFIAIFSTPSPTYSIVGKIIIWPVTALFYLVMFIIKALKELLSELWDAIME